MSFAPSRLTALTLAVTAVLAVVVTSAVRSERLPFPPPVLVLQADNTLVRVFEGKTRVVARFGRPRTALQVNRGRLIQPSGQDIVILIPHSKPLPDELVVVRPRDMERVHKLTLPRGVTFRQFAVRTGGDGVFVLGNRDHDHVVVALTVSRAFDRIGRLRVLRRNGDAALRVNSVALGSGGSTVLVAYHGTNTTGADVFTLPSWHRCPSPKSRTGCLKQVHGEVLANGAQIVGTTGTPPAVSVIRGREEVRRIPLVPDAHVTALATTGSTAYVPGACDAPRGIWIVDLRLGRARRLYGGLPTASMPVSPCGYTAELSRDATWLVTTETALPVPDPERSGAIWIMNLSHRRLPGRVELTVDPVAAAFAAR